MTSANDSTAGLRVAVIGCGRMGLRHLQAVRNLGMEVCALGDASDKALEDARQAANLGSDTCFRDAEHLLAVAKPEALVVATTAPSHAPLVVMAADGGVRYILCEKPMAVSMEEARSMTERCRQAGTILAVNHQMRFMPQYSQVKDLIGSEALGPLSSILVAGSNFGLAMNASHYFEMFRYITNQSVDSIQAWLEEGQLANPRGAQFEDRSGRLLARGHQGVSMFMDFSREAGYGLQVIYICRHGQIFVDELSGDMRIAARKAEFRDLPTTRYGMPAEVQQLTLAPADTVAPTMEVWSALLEGRPFPDGAAGTHALACLVAAHTSHEAGGMAIRLDDPSLPTSRVFPWA